jgi:hypothetical protein
MGSAGWLRAQDIVFVADQRDDDEYEFTNPVDRAAINCGHGDDIGKQKRVRRR